jgi:hypothetical protein
MVFVEESAEQVTSMHPSWLAVADDPQVGEWIRRLQSERPVGTVMVVGGDVDPDHLLEVSSPLISSQSRHSARTVRIQRSAARD